MKKIINIHIGIVKNKNVKLVQKEHHIGMEQNVFQNVQQKNQFLS